MIATTYIQTTRHRFSKSMTPRQVLEYALANPEAFLNVTSVYGGQKRPAYVNDALDAAFLAIPEGYKKELHALAYVIDHPQAVICLGRGDKVLNSAFRIALEHLD